MHIDDRLILSPFEQIHLQFTKACSLQKDVDMQKDIKGRDDSPANCYLLFIGAAEILKKSDSGLK